MDRIDSLTFQTLSSKPKQVVDLNRKNRKASLWDQQEPTGMKFKPLLFCFLGALFYFYESALESTPSLVVNPVMASFHISALKTGWLDSAYYISLLIMQLPGGVMLDKFGPRKAMTFAASLCFIGVALFAWSDSFTLSMLSKFITGLGGAFGTIGAIFIVRSTVSKKHLAIAIGLVIMIGLSGGLISPLFALLIKGIGWRGAFFMLALAAFSLALIFFNFLEDNQATVHRDITFREDINGMIKRGQNWLIGIYGGLLFTPVLCLASVWGVSYIKTMHPHISLADASVINVMIYLGIIIGSPVAGALSDALKTRKPLMVAGCLVCTGIMIFLTVSSSLAIGTIVCLFLLLGLFTSFSGSLTLTMGCELNPNRTGVAVGFINMLSTLPSLFVVPVFGAILDHFWVHGAWHHGHKIFPRAAYQTGMLVVTALLIFALFLIVFLIKDTYHKQLNPEPGQRSTSLP